MLDISSIPLVIQEDSTEYITDESDEYFIATSSYNAFYCTHAKDIARRVEEGRWSPPTKVTAYNGTTNEKGVEKNSFF
jgi:hypothetical protein